MSDGLKQLKEKIYDEGTIGQLLDELGCTDIKVNSGRSGDDLVTARLPGSSNPRGAQIYLSPNLHVELVGEGISGDVYGLVGFMLYGCRNFDEVRSKLYQIKTYICNALGYEYSNNDFFKEQKPKQDWNWWLRDIQKQRPREYEVTKNEVLCKDVLNEFISGAWMGWLNEGISVAAQNDFGVGFHLPSERVTIQVHNTEGQLIGIKGRYVGNDKHQLEHKKYNYIYPCSKTIELFNLHRALPYIQKSKKVYVFEGAKTTMKLWGWNIRNAVSIEGDRLHPVQAKILKGLGIDVEIIWVWDKGKDKEFVRNQIRQIKGRKMFYLYDNKDRFEDKQSPVDCGYEIFMDLLTTDIHDCDELTSLAI
ncbi:DNA primase [Paenibacillus polymyxa]|uniref:DNA primase n=1 Tax=Paenibacillus polymyxa TaxID=1406 RepID=UPI0039BC2D67